MSLTVDATYENGMLKPAVRLPLMERQKVRITIYTPLDVVRATAGMLKWKGDPETVERIALDAEFGIRETKRELPSGE